MLASFPNVKTVNISRNELTSFPQGGPQQFAAAQVEF